MTVAPQCLLRSRQSAVAAATSRLASSICGDFEARQLWSASGQCFYCGFEFLRIAEHRFEKIAHPIEPGERIRDGELTGVQARGQLAPVQRGRDGGSGICAQNVRG